MKLNNFYTIEGLQSLNDSTGYTYKVDDSDTDKVNRLIALIQKVRDNQEEPIAGDIIEYTSRSGEYYGKAHIQRIHDDHREICQDPYVPFCYEMDGSPCYDTSGGPWSCPEKTVLEPAGTGSRQFKTWGHAGRCAHGAVHFCSFVRKYTEPDPLYGNYTTKNWARYFINKMPDPEKPGEFTYNNDRFTAYSETEFDRLVKILHGEVFDGICRNSLVLWGYRMEWKSLTEDKWNGTRGDIHLSFLGTSPVKIKTYDDTHTIIIYKKK